MKIRDLIKIGNDRLKAKNIETSLLDTRLLLMYITGLNKVELFTKDDYELSSFQENNFYELLSRREKYEPMQYILGKAEFMGLEFLLNSDTLIPRADTEIIVEEMLNIGNGKFKTLLDIGTGSGAIAISYAKYDINALVTAIDICQNALDKASENAVINKVNDRITFIKSDLFQNISNITFDCIVSNPPYIRKDVIKTLENQVKDYEPIRALNGGNDGLDFYRKIIAIAFDFLNENGMLFFEIGYDQANDVINLMKNSGYTNVTLKKDLAGLDRVVYGSKIRKD